MDNKQADYQVTFFHCINQSLSFLPNSHSCFSNREVYSQKYTKNLKQQSQRNRRHIFSSKHYRIYQQDSKWLYLDLRISDRNQLNYLCMCYLCCTHSNTHSQKIINLFHCCVLAHCSNFTKYFDSYCNIWPDRWQKFSIAMSKV